MNRGSDQTYWGSVEVLGEIFLLVLVGAFMTYMFVGSFGWPAGSAFLPRIVVLGGAPFVLIRLISLVKRTKSSVADIMDQGFVGTDEDTPKAVMGRLTRGILFVFLLYFAIWMFGFHLALPTGIFIYLLAYSGIGWAKSLIVALVFLGIIFGLYDYVMHTMWHNPIVFSLFRSG
jgi:hypothetical protein